MTVVAFKKRQRDVPQFLLLDSAPMSPVRESWQKQGDVVVLPVDQAHMRLRQKMRHGFVQTAKKAVGVMAPCLVRMLWRMAIGFEAASHSLYVAYRPEHLQAETFISQITGRDYRA